MNFVLTFLPILLSFVLIIGLEIFLGVYVYKDATRRGMNGVLWTLIVVFAPYLIGLIIYLIVRGSHSDMSCPVCDERVTEQYVVCPKCGASLKSTCPACNAPVEAGWKVCPSCANPLPEDFNVKKPKKAKDHLWKVLVAIIVIPLLIIMVSFFLLVGVKSTGGSSDNNEMSTSLDLKKE